MNKKQKILTWITVALTILNIIFPLPGGNRGVLARAISILFVGIILIYIARDKNQPVKNPKEISWKKKH